MEQLQDHSIRGYLTRLPTSTLEILWNTQWDPECHLALLPEDYVWIERILQSRPDRSVFTPPNETP